VIRTIVPLLIGILFLTACSSPTPQPTSTPTSLPTSTPQGYRQGWNLVWHDEFDGSAVDPKNWTYDLGGNGWGNAELEDYTNRPENVRLENGLLIIEGREEQYEGRLYTSARLKSQGLQEFQYGRIEARMKLPSGQGMWPAFWMLGNDIDKTTTWPNSGEIDIMEFIGKTPDTLYQTVHGPGYSGARGIGGHVALTADTLRNDFHVFAIEWEPNQIRWFVDDQQASQVTPAQIPAGTKWVFDHPFFIIMNLAVGGGWPGYPDSTTVFPQQLQVDYVRVYQQTGGASGTP
jgi:beta-glucanase (GH16 family)